MIGVIINLDLRGLESLREYSQASKDENFVFIALSETDFEALEDAKDKIKLLVSPRFLKGVKYTLCGSYDPTTNTMSIENCEERFLDLLFETIHKFFDNELTIVMPYKTSFLDKGFTDIFECNVGLCIKKKNTFLNSVDKKSAKIQLSYLKKMYNSDFCSMSLKLEKDTVEYLEYITRAGVTPNKDGNGMSQKEVFGKFRIVKSEIYKGQITHTLRLDKDSIVYGEEDEITTTGSLYNFHSHPLNAYLMYGAKYGVPSLSDYIAVYALCKAQNTIVHFVAALEGIYVISINPKAKACSLTMREGIKYVKKNFSYNEGRVIEDLDHYMKFVNSKDLFKVRLMSWKSLEKQSISLQFKKVGNLCVIHDYN
jgi:hypothetical protein